MEASKNNTRIIAGVNLNNPTETFKVVMVLCLVIFVVAVLFFSSLRLRFRQIYSPRMLLIENKPFTIGTMPRSFFSWITPSIMTTDEDVYTFAGIDALVFIRFLKLILKLALFTLPYGMIVLLPININGGNNLVDGLDRLSMSNVKTSSSLLWAHCLAVWLYTFAVIYLTFEEWKVYIKYRQSYLKKGTPNQFVIFLQNIPQEVSSLCFWNLVKDDNVHMSYITKLRTLRSLVNILATNPVSFPTPTIDDPVFFPNFSRARVGAGKNSYQF